VSYIIECYGLGFTYCTDICDFSPLSVTHKVRFSLVLSIERTTPVRTSTNFYYLTVMN